MIYTLILYYLIINDDIRIIKRRSAIALHSVVLLCFHSIMFIFLIYFFFIKNQIAISVINFDTYGYRP